MVPLDIREMTTDEAVAKVQAALRDMGCRRGRGHRRWHNPPLKAGRRHPPHERWVWCPGSVIIVTGVLSAELIEHLVHSAPIGVKTRPGGVKLRLSGWKNGLLLGHSHHVVSDPWVGAMPEGVGEGPFGLRPRAGGIATRNLHGLQGIYSGSQGR